VDAVDVPSSDGTVLYTIRDADRARNISRNCMVFGSASLQIVLFNKLNKSFFSSPYSKNEFSSIELFR
jgi:hypothetical protein